ncbi:hypothetical protein FACS1894190_09880 [Spirochaetia bacterium]|nr:hypothetical protein FACS1894190_09880 [Spirochaetia bacterium]
MKKFNVTGLCIPAKHYMVDTREKLAKIKTFIDAGSYFTINRARQYGKTTTLYLLKQKLMGEYIVASISFEGVGNEPFETVQSFCAMLMRLIQKSLKFSSASESYTKSWFDENVTDFSLLDEHIAKFCRGNKLVLFIDEVDKTSANQVFLSFLGMLRNKYLARESGEDFTFHSVVLAGVNDIKTIKLQLVSQGLHTLSYGEAAHNSPWNIAVDFNVDMSFSPAEISTMLTQYDDDHHTGMDIPPIAQEIYDYTSGYPFLVSRICQRIDEILDKDWTVTGVRDAGKIILSENCTLFDSIFKNLENDVDLYKYLYNILVRGTKETFSFANPVIRNGLVMSLLKNHDGKVALANRIFEIWVYDYLIAKFRMEENHLPNTGIVDDGTISNGKFNMELCLTKFAEHYEELYHDKYIDFLEEHGRILFLTYLKPLINGKGFYYIESQFTDLRRMDIVVDYESRQFILELKIWRGETAHEKAYEQLAGYLKSKHVNEGYLVTFDLRKGKNHKQKSEWVEFAGKKIFDVVV